MVCDRIVHNQESNTFVKSTFTYELTEDKIDNIEFKYNREHKGMTLRTKAYQTDKFDLLIVCTGSPFDISPTVACVPTGVRLDRPMSYYDHKRSVYTAVPLFTREEKELLLQYYNKVKKKE